MNGGFAQVMFILLKTHRSHSRLLVLHSSTLPNDENFFYHHSEVSTSQHFKKSAITETCGLDLHSGSTLLPFRRTL